MLGQAGTLANAIATNASRMTSLTGAGYPANLFVVNPTIAGGGAFVLTNSGSSYYNAGIVEVRRRLSSGVQLQASYTWAKALANAATASATDFSTPTTLRNRNLDKVPEAFDIRNAIKINGIYELPFGPGRRFNSSNVVARKIMEGWQIAGVARFSPEHRSSSLDSPPSTRLAGPPEWCSTTSLLRNCSRWSESIRPASRARTAE